MHEKGHLFQLDLIDPISVTVIYTTNFMQYNWLSNCSCYIVQFIKYLYDTKELIRNRILSEFIEGDGLTWRDMGG